MEAYVLTTAAIYIFLANKVHFSMELLPLSCSRIIKKTVLHKKYVKVLLKVINFDSKFLVWIEKKILCIISFQYCKKVPQSRRQNSTNVSWFWRTEVHNQVVDRAAFTRMTQKTSYFLPLLPSGAPMPSGAGDCIIQIFASNYTSSSLWGSYLC